MMKHIIKQVLLMVFAVVFFVAVGVICFNKVRNLNEAKTFKELAELVESAMSGSADTSNNIPDATWGQGNIPNDTAAEDSGEVTESNGDNNYVYPVDIKNLSVLYDLNPDFIGWISIADTPINYPVMHTVNDPEKYIYRDFYGNSSRSGVPFLDYRCHTDQGNLIIYGHNYNDKTMFSTLTKYTDYQYRTSHEVICFQIGYTVYRFRVIDVLVTTVSDKAYNYLTSEGKRVLMLSTCYGSNKKDRIIVVAEEF